MTAAICHLDDLEFDAKEMQQLELNDLELVESYSIEMDVEIGLRLAAKSRNGKWAQYSGEECAPFRKDENNARQNCEIEGTLAACSEPLSEEVEEFTASMLDPLLDLERESDFDDCSASYVTDALYGDLMGSPTSLEAESEAEVSRRAIPLKDNSGLNRPSRSSSLDSFEQEPSELLDPQDLAEVFKSKPTSVNVNEAAPSGNDSTLTPTERSNDSEKQNGNFHSCQKDSGSTHSAHLDNAVPESKRLKSSNDKLTSDDTAELAEMSYQRYLERRAKILKWLERRPRRVFSKAAQRGRTQKGKVAQKRKRNHLGRFL